MQINDAAVVVLILRYYKSNHATLLFSAYFDSLLCIFIFIRKTEDTGREMLLPFIFLLSFLKNDMSVVVLIWFIIDDTTNLITFHCCSRHILIAHSVYFSSPARQLPATQDFFAYFLDIWKGPFRWKTIGISIVQNLKTKYAAVCEKVFCMELYDLFLDLRYLQWW